MIPKPSQVKRGLKPCFKTMKDGRTIIDLTMPQGRLMRDAILASAWSRDNGLCGICGKYVCLLDAVWDHIVPRGMGGATRDDVLDNIRAAHFDCNSRRGSIRDFVP